MVCEEGPCRWTMPARRGWGAPSLRHSVEGWVGMLKKRERWVGVQPRARRREEEKPQPYPADSKALLQPVPMPVSICICQTDLWVRKNSARGGGHRPALRLQVPPRRETATWLFMSHRPLDSKKGEIIGREAKGCFQDSSKGLWQVLVAGNSTRGPSRAGGEIPVTLTEHEVTTLKKKKIPQDDQKKRRKKQLSCFSMAPPFLPA